MRVEKPLEESPIAAISRDLKSDSAFCPQADGGEYRAWACLPGCTICRDLLITRSKEATP